jgi:hypothetical protein
LSLAVRIFFLISFIFIQRFDRMSQSFLSLAAVVFLSLSIFFKLTQSASSSNTDINSAAGSEAIQLIIAVFSLIFGIPIVLWVYRNYLERLLVKASKKAADYRAKMQERLSAAGRKVSERVRAG